jgi:hypothetical protein
VLEPGERVEALVAALRLVEFGSCDGCGAGRFCLWCSQQDEFEYSREHLADCPVAKALA